MPYLSSGEAQPQLSLPAEAALKLRRITLDRGNEWHISCWLNRPLGIAPGDMPEKRSYCWSPAHYGVPAPAGRRYESG